MSVCFKLQIPIVIPIAFLLISIFLLITPIIQDPKLEFLYAVLFCMGSTLIYIPLVHYKTKPKILGENISNILVITR